MSTSALSLNRSDFDGLVCAAVLKELELLHDILFVHPKDVQDGKVALRPTTSQPTSPIARRWRCRSTTMPRSCGAWSASGITE